MIYMTIEPGNPVAGRLVYRAAEYAFATEPRPVTCGASFTINELELLLDDEENQRMLIVEGYCPHSGWQKSDLGVPASHPGILRAAIGSRIMPGGAIAVNSKDDRWPVLVDPVTGWVRLGTGDPHGDREGVTFAPSSIAVLEGNHLRALWLHPDQLPSL